MKSKSQVDGFRESDHLFASKCRVRSRRTFGLGLRFLGSFWASLWILAKIGPCGVGPLLVKTTYKGSLMVQLSLECLIWWGSIVCLHPRGTGWMWRTQSNIVAFSWYFWFCNAYHSVNRNRDPWPRDSNEQILKNHFFFIAIPTHWALVNDKNFVGL